MTIDWVTRNADAIERAHPEGQLTLASGISPSGPIHMGNLREVLTTHFIADELSRRGREVRHLHSWDDYDRLRKVPKGVDGVSNEWEKYIGMPLTSVPAPNGSIYNNWAEHFKNEFVESLRELSVNIHQVSQSEMYLSGAYRDNIIHALNNRKKIGEILASRQTKGDILEIENYYPFKPYCSQCHRDSTRVNHWDTVNEQITYTCSCGNSVIGASIGDVEGKLVWKVDWPMRWAFENVVFEPGGVDHMSPGSSWDVGKEIASIFAWERPIGIRYSFVGIDGAAKISSSAGGAPTPSMVLPVLGPEIVRWLYVRQRPEQAFNIDLERNTSRLYDEWDSFSRKFHGGELKNTDESIYRRAVYTNLGGNSLIGVDALQMGDIKFSAWASYADITLCRLDEMKRLASETTSMELDVTRAQRAIAWVENYMDPEERTSINSDFRSDYYNSLNDEAQATIQLLADNLEDYWDSLENLTRWCFGAAKAHMGIDIDERKLDDDAKAFQKEYFTNVYQLLISKNAGPRLPNLLRLIGIEESRCLLTGK